MEPTNVDPEPIVLSEEQIEEEKKEEKKLKHSLDCYIIFSFASVIIYTVVQMVLVVKTGMTLDVLTTCIFGLFGGEILACAMIKRFKLKEEKGGGKG